MIYKVILNFIGLHLKTEINEALVTNSKASLLPLYINDLHAVSLITRTENDRRIDHQFIDCCVMPLSISARKW